MAEIELSVLARQCLDRRIPGADNFAARSLGRSEEISSLTVDWRLPRQMHALSQTPYPSILPDI